MSPRRQRKWDRAQFIHDNCPAYYRGPFRRPNEMIDPLGALAWDQTEIWMTAREWLHWIRRSGRPYKVWRYNQIWGPSRAGKWVPISRPCIRCMWLIQSTTRVGMLP